MNKCKSYSNIFFEDIASYKNTNFHAEKIWTSSPGVLEYLKEQKISTEKLGLIDSLTSEQELNNFNFNLVKGRKELSVILNNFDYKVCNIFRTEIYKLFLVLGYKSLILSNWVNSISSNVAIVGSSKLKKVEGVDSTFGAYDHLYYNLIDQVNTKDFFDIDLIEVPPIDNKLFDNSFNKVPIFDRVFNIINRPLSAICFKLWMKAGFFKIGFNIRGHIKFLELNEGIEEVFIPLLNSGWKLGKISFPNFTNINSNEEKYLSLVSEISKLWMKLTSEFINKSTQNKARIIIEERLLKSLSSYEIYKDEYKKIISNIPNSTVILSNGLYSTKLRIAASILREKNFIIYTTDHGSSAGLNEWFNHISEDLFNYSSMHLTYNSITETVCNNTNNKANNVGTPKVIINNRLKKIQRFLARIRCNVYTKKPILMYVSYLFSNNKPIGMGTGLDNNYNEFRKKLFKAINKFSGKTIIKPYPALRFIDDMYTTKYLDKKNYIIPQGEFRQLRWAADLIIIDNASSTILWAISSDIPLILINCNRNKLTEEAKIELTDAIFLFDENDNDWNKKLKEFLSLNIKEIRKLWHSKKYKRKLVSYKYINGDIGMFAENVTNIINKNNARV